MKLTADMIAWAFCCACYWLYLWSPRRTDGSRLSLWLVGYAGFYGFCEDFTVFRERWAVYRGGKTE